MFAPVICLIWDDPSDPAPWILTVSSVPGYQVDMKMGNSLTSYRTVIYTDVVGLWGKLFIDCAFGAVEQF